MADLSKVEWLNRCSDSTTRRFSGLLSFVFALAEALIDLEAGLLRVRDGERLKLVRRAEAGNDLAHRLFARRAFGQRLGGQRAVQRERPAAHLALAVADFVFVKRHKQAIFSLALLSHQVLFFSSIGKKLAGLEFQKVIKIRHRSFQIAFGLF